MRRLRICLILVLSILIKLNSLAQCTCTDVTPAANPCPPVATLYTDVNAAAGAPQVKTTFTAVPFAVSGTSKVFCTKYTIPAGVTKIGVLNYMGTPNVTSFNRGNWQAFDVSGCSSPISGTTATAPSGGAAEFVVTPGSTYKFCVTIDISSNYTNGEITSSEFYMYNATTSTTCPASVGTLSVNGGTSVSATEYNLTTNGAAITISSSGSVLPTASSGNTSTYGYFVFDQQPTLPFSDVTPTAITALPGFKGVVSGTSINDNNGSGKSTSVTTASTLWFVPAVFDKKTGGLALDDDLDGCYAVGTPIKVNYSVTTPPPSCATCSTATCTATSVSATTVAQARTDLTTALGTAGDQYGGLLLVPNENTTICVPVTVPQGSTRLGFKMRTTLAPGGCGNPAEQIVTYELKPVGCGATIAPTRTNGQPVSSGFNPEWDNIAAGNYTLCFTMNTDPMMFCSTVELHGIGYYNVGTVCPATNGSHTVTINNAVAPASKNPATREYILCNADNIKINTTGANPNTDYAIYKCAPTTNNPATDACYTGFYAETFNALSETSTGNTSSVLAFLTSQGITFNKNTIWWVPIATATVGGYDPACFHMDYQNESYKATYLNDISITKNEVCASSKVTLTISGGSPEFVTGSTYTIATNKGTLSATSLSSSGGTVDLTGLNTNDAYTITVTDGVGCTKTFSGTYTCTCTPPTITPATPLSVCTGTASTTFTYTSTGTPTTYSIDWDLTANTAGFIDVVDAPLTASPQTITLPAGASAATYTGSLTVKNAGGCTSVAQNISVTLNSGPSISGTATLCIGATTQLNGTGTANTTNPWVSETVANATINASGLVTGIAAGTSVITYKDNNGCTANQTVTVNGNPTITANPTSFLVGATSAITVVGGSGTAAAVNPWVSSTTANATIVGAGQSATVTGVALGNSNIIYTDNKGCDDTVQVTVTIPGCETINNPSADQVLCQGADPAVFTVSTSETAANGINYVVYPAATKPANAAAVYSGVGTLGISLSKVTPAAGVATLDLPALGSAGSLPVVIAGDYYVYAILDPVPSDVNCRPYAEIKVTINDSVVPVVTASAVLGDSTVFSWNNNPAASKWGVEGALTPTNTSPSSWINLGSIPNAAGGAPNKHTTPGIPLGQTAHIKITPQDNAGVQLVCSNTADASITNPNCTKPIPLALTAPNAVCEGASINVVGGLNVSSVLADFKWRITLDGTNWMDVTGADYDVTTVPSTFTVPVSKIAMKNAQVKLIVTDQATGKCKDSTLAVPLTINELPNASISINPDPAVLCVGANQLITVTFIGNKGTAPYVFDYTLDGVANIDSSLVGSSVLTYDFDTNDEIVDSTFILTKVTDKFGCSKTINANNTVKMQVIPAPQPVFTADQTVGCFPFTVIFTDKSSSLNTKVEWDFGDGSPVSTDLGFTKYTFQKAGDYSITFKSIMNGCSDTMFKSNYIHVKDRPTAQFSPKKTNISMIEPVVNFINSSSNNAVSFKWVFGDGSPISTEKNPIHTFIGQGINDLPAPGKYKVELYAYVNQDCWDSTSTTITIDDEQIYYIPNTFTPNGDEKNNVFQPVFTSGFDAQNYHFSIFDRWGELVFESNNPTIGWDGTYGNKIVMNGTFTWKLQFKEKMTEKEHYLTGHVNLIK
jgi:gliding motility-associated-like protein